jgi:hypothetical protein
MHLAVLASVHPSFTHARAANVVLASLLEAHAKGGHRVSLFTAGCPNAPDEDALASLAGHGVRHVADLTAETASEPILPVPFRDLRTVRKAFFPAEDDDYPRFTDAAVQRIEEHGADAALLFWDSWLEHLVPALRRPPVVGYLARPRFASPLAAVEAGTLGRGPRAWVAARNLHQQEKRHLRRVARLAAATNICAVDASYYARHGIRCDYVPNTWPDIFGADWHTRREAAEAARPKVHVLANIGNVGATGNGFGLRYLADEVLPRLPRGMLERLEINICGGGRIDPVVAARLVSFGVRIRGFIDDIDGELLANRVFLLLNNAGPYTGGYTRVMYAFSSGSCLVAHRQLSESMPEVEHDANSLLGSSADEIAALLARATSDAALARRLGEGARRTYESRYSPAIVAAALVERCRRAAQ